MKKAILKNLTMQLQVNIYCTTIIMNMYILNHFSFSNNTLRSMQIKYACNMHSLEEFWP